MFHPFACMESARSEKITFISTWRKIGAFILAGFAFTILVEVLPIVLTLLVFVIYSLFPPFKSPTLDSPLAAVIQILTLVFAAWLAALVYRRFARPSRRQT